MAVETHQELERNERSMVQRELQCTIPSIPHAHVRVVSASLHALTRPLSPEVYRSSAELEGLAEHKENTTRHGDTDELFSAVLYLFNRSLLTAKFTVSLKVQTLAPYIGTCPCPNLEVTCVTDSWMCWVREWMVHDNNGVSNSCFTVGRRNQIHPPCFTTWSS